MIRTASKLKTIPAVIAMLALAACGDGAAPENEVSETVLGDIDVLEGSASDAMITVDEFDSGGAATQSAAPNTPAPNAAAGDAPAAAPSEDSDGAETIRPRSRPQAPPSATDNDADTADTGV